MKIDFRLYASLSRHAPKTGGNGLTVDVGEGTSINDLLRRYGVPADSVAIIFLNGVHAKGDEVLKEGDRVGVFPPIAGG